MKNISQSDLPEFSLIALAVFSGAAVSPHSAALQTENVSCVIRLKENETVRRF